MSLFKAFTALSVAANDPKNSAATMKEALFDPGTGRAWIFVTVQNGTRGQTLRLFQTPNHDIILDDGREAHTINARSRNCRAEIRKYYADKVRSLVEAA